MDQSDLRPFSGKVTAEEIFAIADSTKRKTKIVCTIGPACRTIELLVQMLDLGMNIARLNFSHGDHAYHAETVRLIREANKMRPEKACAIMLDTKGPEIRTGILRNH